MIIQTTTSELSPLAVMMFEHNALCLQFIHAFGNDRFETPEPAEQMCHVISHHDAGWFNFDRDPQINSATGLPYNLGDTPMKFITETSRLSPEYNERNHPYCGLISSMHSWGLYNGRYGYSKLVLLENIPAKDRPLVDKMLADEMARQTRLKAELSKYSEFDRWVDVNRVMQNYKLLQFIDTLALYFNRIHPAARDEQVFENVPISQSSDVNVTIKRIGDATYQLTPFPFSSNGSEFAFSGRRITPEDGGLTGGWPAALRRKPLECEVFRLVTG